MLSLILNGLKSEQTIKMGTKWRRVETYSSGLRLFYDIVFRLFDSIGIRSLIQQILAFASTPLSLRKASVVSVIKLRDEYLIDTNNRRTKLTRE